MKISDLAAINLKLIPTEVLQEMYRAMHKELDYRRAIIKVSSRHQGMNCDEPFKRMPREHHIHDRHHLNFLDELMEQDWSHLFFGGDPEPKYYVYAHVTPNTKKIINNSKFKLSIEGVPFYIGKGTGSRAFDMKRNQGHGVELHQLQSRGHSVNEIAHILIDGLTEAKALEFESKLIYFFGTKFEKNRRGILVNLEIPKTPF